MKTQPHPVLFGLLILYSTGSAYADGFAQTGFTGYLRTPDARVVNTGSVRFSAGWEDHVDYNTNYGIGAHHTLLLGLGLLPGMEFSVQNTYKNFDGAAGYDAGNSGSDLSFSAKLNSQPLLPDNPLQFAVGVQDYGTHSATYHNNYYLVGQLTLDPIDLSVGYGRGDEKNQMGADYLDGPFAGGRWSVNPYLELIADYDGTGANGGMRLTAPERWLPDGWGLNATFQGISGSSTLNRDNAWLSIGLKIDFEHDTEKSAETYTYQPYRVDDLAAAPTTSSAANRMTPDEPTNLPVSPAIEDPRHWDDLLSQLDRLGLENLRIGAIGAIPLITFENNVYLRNEMTALGSALGMISQHIQGWFYLVAQSKQIPILALKAHGAALLDSHRQSIRPLMRHLQYIRRDPAELMTHVTWQTETLADSRYKPRVNLSIAQQSTLGTEWGVLDYSVASATNAVFDLWPGGALDVRHLHPLAESDDADFARHPIDPYRSTVDRALFHQALPLNKNTFTQFSIGKILDDYFALLNESRWQSDTGQHRLTFLGGVFDPITDSIEDQSMALGYYRYYFPDARYGIEFFGGRYLNGDRGYGVRTLHWFGNTQVNLEIKTNGEQSYAGMYFAFPLSFAHSMRPDPIQFTGIDEWRWGYRTQVDGTQNQVNNAALVETKLQHNLERAYFNRDRLSLQHFYANLPTLMEAFGNIVTEAGEEPSHAVTHPAL